MAKMFFLNKIFQKYRNIIFVSATIALSAAFSLFFVLKFFISYQTNLKMEMTQTNNGFMQIFYPAEVPRHVDPYSEKDSIIIRDTAKKNYFDIVLPLRKSKSIRLDFTHPACITIKNMKICGRSEQDMSKMNISFVNDCKISQKTSDKLVIQTTEKDPYIEIVYPKIKGRRSWNPTLFSAAFVLLSILFYLPLSFILSAWNRKLLHPADIGLLLILSALLLIPASKINKEDISKTENRTLAAMPKLFSSQKRQINQRFGAEFEQFFNDRFFGRELLIPQFRKLLQKINNIKQLYFGESVIEGKDKWYFYRKENSVENFQNSERLPAQTMKEWLTYLNQFNQYCKKNNILFYYYIAPDKNRVYGEKFPIQTKMHPDSLSRAAVWVDYIKRNSDIKVIYPLEYLMQRKGEHILYYKNNTHWNHAGAYYGYHALMDEVKKDLPEVNVFTSHLVMQEKHPEGDLYLMAPESVEKDDTTYAVPSLLGTHKCPDLRRDEVIINQNVPESTLIIIRDSFGAGMLDYLHYSFKTICVLRRFLLTTDDCNLFTNSNNKPTVVVLEHVERNLPIMGPFMRSTTVLNNN